MKNTLLLTVISLVLLIGCKTNNSISAQALHLVEPGNLQNFKGDVLCQFHYDKVEIYSYKDRSKNTADVSVGSYSMGGGKLSFPKGTFNIKKIGENYKLTSNGKIKYLLLTDTAYNSFISNPRLLQM